MAKRLCKDCKNYIPSGNPGYGECLFGVYYGCDEYKTKAKNDATNCENFKLKYED